MSPTEAAQLRNQLAALRLQALRFRLSAALDRLDAGSDEQHRIEYLAREIHSIALVPRAAA